MSNKLSKKDLDLLIEHILSKKYLNEAEYVSGSKELSRKAAPSAARAQFIEKAIMEEGTPESVIQVFQRMKDLIEDPENVKFGSGRLSSMEAKFKRMVVLESFHKLCLNTIERTERVPLDYIQAGFGMEVLFTTVMGGQRVHGKVEDVTVGSDHYSLKFIGNNTDVTQSLDFLEKTENKDIVYVIFRKVAEGDKIGFDLYSGWLLEDKLEAIYAAKDNPEDAGEILKKANITVKGDKDIVVFTTKDLDNAAAFGTVSDEKVLQGPLQIRMPADLSAFMDIALSTMGDQVKTLYTSLNRFKESLNAYYATRGKEKEENLSEATRNLINVNESYKQAMPVDESLSLFESKQKNSKKDLDNFIKEVILNKNK